MLCPEKNSADFEGWREIFFLEVKATEIEKENIKCLVILQRVLI